MRGLDWDGVRERVDKRPFEEALQVKMVMAHFKLLVRGGGHDLWEELFDIFNEVKIVQERQKVSHEHLPMWASTLELFLKTLATKLTEPLIEYLQDPLLYYIRSIATDNSLLILKGNLRFVLNLTSNFSFMTWAELQRLNLFSIMDNHIESTIIDLECIEIAVKIHYNLLLCESYIGAMFSDPWT